MIMVGLSIVFFKVESKILLNQSLSLIVFLTLLGLSVVLVVFKDKVGVLVTGVQVMLAASLSLSAFLGYYFDLRDSFVAREKTHQAALEVNKIPSPALLYTRAIHASQYAVLREDLIVGFASRKDGPVDFQMIEAVFDSGRRVFISGTKLLEEVSAHPSYAIVGVDGIGTEHLQEVVRIGLAGK